MILASLPKRLRLFGFLLAVVTFVVYLPSLSNDFVALDDNHLIYENQLVLNFSVSNLIGSFMTYDPELYIPLTFLTYQFENLIFGLNPLIFHLTSLVLHLASVFLVLWSVFLLAQRRNDDTVAAWIAGTCALVFALHPISTEAVAWAAARKDVLSTFFFFLSLGLYLKGNRTWSIATFALGLLAKVSIIMLPIVLILVDSYAATEDVQSVRAGAANRAKNWISSVAKEKWPWFALSFVFGIVALLGKTVQLTTVTLVEKFLLSSKAILFYLSKLFWPSGFTVFYPQDSAITLSSAEFALPLLFLLFLFFLLFLSHKKHWHATFFGLGFYLLLLAPSFTNFFKNGFIYFASDRYAYVAIIGIVFAIARYVFTRLQGQNIKLVGGLLASIGLLLATLSYQQSRTWHDTESLNRHGLALYPSSVQNLHNIGSTLFTQGRFAEAREYYAKALAVNPELPEAYMNLGRLSSKEGDLTMAMQQVRTGIENIPTHRPLLVRDLQLFFFLGTLLEDQGKTDEAIAMLEQAAARGEKFFIAHLNLGIMYHKNFRLEEAAASYEKAVELNPRNLDARYRLAAVYGELGALVRAQEQLEYIVIRDPNYEKAAFHLQQLRNLK